MKKLVSLWMVLLLAVSTAACGTQKADTSAKENTEAADVPTTEQDNGKTLVAYFSATGNTEAVAKQLQVVLGADGYEIVPEELYTADDLNYNNDDCRANKEQNDSTARPAISGSVENMSDYDVVFVGYPIWWGKAPKIIDTFLESYDFSGKTVIPFCTSGSSGIAGSLNEIKSAALDADWKVGRRFSANVSETDLQEWVSDLGLSGTNGAK